MKTERLYALTLMRSHGDMPTVAKVAIRLNFAPKRTDNYRISLSSIKISNMFSEGPMYPLGTEICSPKNMWAFHGSRTNTETLSRLRKNRSDHGFT